MITIIISAIISAITVKIVATYYFKKVDGYVKAWLFTLPKRAMKRRRPGTINSSRLKV